MLGAYLSMPDCAKLRDPTHVSFLLNHEKTFGSGAIDGIRAGRVRVRSEKWMSRPHLSLARRCQKGVVGLVLLPHKRTGPYEEG